MINAKRLKKAFCTFNANSPKSKAKTKVLN